VSLYLVRKKKGVSRGKHALTEKPPCRPIVAHRVVIDGDRIPADPPVGIGVNEQVCELEQLLAVAQFEESRDVHQIAFLNKNESVELH
jgi:hypothetical protein